MGGKTLDTLFFPLLIFFSLPYLRLPQILGKMQRT